ncbi:hypothetical protein EGW08_000492 [Elysia chlorotica]|uniref:Uncharacterized protein n=1 Tax=Elysia chlorotica TaxID=188477 RepID=A0A433UDE3_ELYCH|nr:hypothetical protein EGW08_000492 [Elysia chlorotica]
MLSKPENDHSPTLSGGDHSSSESNRQVVSPACSPLAPPHTGPHVQSLNAAPAGEGGGETLNQGACEYRAETESECRHPSPDPSGEGTWDGRSMHSDENQACKPQDNIPYSQVKQKATSCTKTCTSEMTNSESNATTDSSSSEVRRSGSDMDLDAPRKRIKLDNGDSLHEDKIPRLTQDSNPDLSTSISKSELAVHANGVVNGRRGDMMYHVKFS